jgi:LysM repeat protein
VNYSYDAAGNRTDINAYYASSNLSLQHQDLWYTYDKMNRVAISQGADISNTVTVNSTQGTLLGYNTRGDRTSAMTYSPVIQDVGGVYSTPTSVQNTQAYAYDGDDRLTTTTTTTATTGSVALVTDSRSYDRASRETGDTYLSLNTSNQLVTNAQTTTYLADGELYDQLTTQKVGTGAAVNESDVQYLLGGESGYDAAGNLTNYSVLSYNTSGGLVNTGTNVLTYRAGDSYQQLKHTVTNTNGQAAGETDYTYNANGELVEFADVQTPTNDRYFDNNAQGQTISVVKGNDGAYNSTAVLTAFTGANAGSAFFNSANAGYFFFDAAHQQVGTFGQLDTGLKANFDVNFTPISQQYPTQVPSQYIVQAGDTLRSIAAHIYGDSKLWYVIAQANGLTDPNATQTPGVSLTIPNVVTGLSNTAGSYKPFNVANALGNTTPTQPAPPPQHGGGGCGIIGLILVIIVAIVVTVYTAGLAAGAADASVVAADGTIASATAGSTFAAGAAAISGGLVTADGAALVGTSIAAAAVGGAVGSLASQLVGDALGIQSGISWQGVALSAIGSGVAAGLGAAGAGISALRTFQTASPYLYAAGNAAASNAITQGIAVVTGLQNSFNWESVAVAAISAPIAKYVGQEIGQFVDPSFDPKSTLPSVGKFVSDVTGSISTAAVNAVVDGKVNVEQVVANAFGAAIGNSIVAVLSPDTTAAKPAPDHQGTSDASGGAQSTTTTDQTSDQPLDKNQTTSIISGSVETPDELQEIQIQAQKITSYTAQTGQGPLAIASNIDPDHPYAVMAYLAQTGQINYNQDANRWITHAGQSYSGDLSGLSDDQMSALDAAGRNAVSGESSIDTARAQVALQLRQDAAAATAQSNLFYSGGATAFSTGSLSIGAPSFSNPEGGAEEPPDFDFADLDSLYRIKGSDGLIRYNDPTTGHFASNPLTKPQAEDPFTADVKVNLFEKTFVNMNSDTSLVDGADFLNDQLHLGVMFHDSFQIKTDVSVSPDPSKWGFDAKALAQASMSLQYGKLTLGNSDQSIDITAQSQFQAGAGGTATINDKGIDVGGSIGAKAVFLNVHGDVTPQTFDIYGLFDVKTSESGDLNIIGAGADAKFAVQLNTSGFHFIVGAGVTPLIGGSGTVQVDVKPSPLLVSIYNKYFAPSSPPNK